MRGRAFEFLLAEAWAVRPEYLDLGVAIALREHEPMAVEAREGRPIDGMREAYRRDSVAVIPMVGPIFRYANLFTELCGGATVESIARDLQAAVDDDSVSAIVLNIDSPGGQASGIGELAAMIRAATDRKPVVSYVGNQAASAAYYAGVGASEVVIAPMAMLGSIGVVRGYSKPGNDRSIEFVSSQSPNKRPDLETEKGRAVIQSEVDALAEVFVADVARYREVSVETVLNDFGKGGVLVGQKAVDAGMADRIGSFESVVAELNEAAQRKPSSPYQPGRLAATQEPSMSTPETTAAAEPQANGADLKTIADLKAQVAALTKQVDSEASAAIEARAVTMLQTFADRIVAAESAGLKSLFVQLANDDRANPLATGSRVEMFRASIEARPKHSLTRSQVAAKELPSHVQAMGQRANPKAPADPDEPTAENVDSLLELIPEGREVLKAQAKKAG